MHVLSSLERSGMEMMLACSFAEWQNAGYECDLLATAAEEGPAAEMLRQFGYGVFHLPFRGRMHLVPSADFVRGFRKLCGTGYDVVHIHTEANALLCAALAKSSGVPRLAVTPHNEFRFTGLLRARKVLERGLVRWMGGRYGMISESVRRNERQRFLNRGVDISNWIDTEFFVPPTAEQKKEARSVLGFSADDFVLVSVGNCNAAKNHDELLRALATLRDERWSYLHIGREAEGGPERRLAGELGIAERTHFLGSLAGLRPILWASDCFVMPSLNEGMPISCIEAIACGVPIVVSDVAGLRDIAASAGKAVLTGTDARSIADGLRTVLTMSGDERAAMGERCSRNIRQEFSIEHGIRTVVTGLYGNDAANREEARGEHEDRVLRSC